MKIVVGVDEVGRGSLIGPVYAAAVILKKSINKKLLKDSKSLTKSKRQILSKYIKKSGGSSTCGPQTFCCCSTITQNVVFTPVDNS